MNKTSVMVAILTGHERHFWINPELFRECLSMMEWQRRTGSILHFCCIHGLTPVDAARNAAVTQFLRSPAEWLLQIDNDVVPPSPLNLLAAIGDRKIVGLPCAIGHHLQDVTLNLGTPSPRANVYNLNLRLDEGWQEVGAVGTGCLLAHREVFVSLEDPWFECSRASILEGRKHAGEDFSFCEKARARGFRVYTHASFPCKHIKSFDLGEVLNLRVTQSDPIWQEQQFRLKGDEKK